MKLDVIGIVLHGVEDVVAIFVPVTAGEADGALDAGPDFREEILVTAQLPFAIGAQDRAHLAVDGSVRSAAPDEVVVEGPERPEAHETIIAGLHVEFDTAHFALQRWEKIGDGEGITPDMGAIAGAATVFVIAALPTVEASVLGPETGGAAQRHDIGGDGIQHNCRQCGGEQSVMKLSCYRFQSRQMFNDIATDIPGIGEARRIVIAYDAHVLFSDT